MVTRIEKPWGYEVIFAHTKQYVGKILNIKKGHKLSLQYHKEKDETVYLHAGKMTLEIHSDNSINSIKMLPGMNFHITPNTIHRMIAEEDCEVLEASTTQLDDVVRVEDDYGR
jgi:quercetin dioxygenase-like cupin family protein